MDERAYLKREVRRHRVARSLSERCRMILPCPQGVPSKAVGPELGVHEHRVRKWWRRFLKDRVRACWMMFVRAGPAPSRAAVIERTLRSMPADATRRSIRSMAAATGYSHTTTRRIWRAFGLQPRRSQSFKLPAIPCSSTKSAISSAFPCRRLVRRWFSASTKRVSSRRSIAHSPSCR